MKYAIVESGGKQFKAVEGGTLEVDRLPVETGTSIKLEQVLLLADGEEITVGTPLVKNTPVWTKVVEHFRGPKVHIFNYSPKKRIRVKIGHRQNYTRLVVEQIGGSELAKKESAKVKKAEEVPSQEMKQAVTVKKPRMTGKTELKKAPATSRAKKPVPAASSKTTARVTSKPGTKSITKKAGAKKSTSKASSPKGKTAPKKSTRK
jgi:large subunit ribosomal protein L21